MRCCLTFDDGPDPRWTGSILDALHAHNAHATFFVCGWAITSTTETLLRRMIHGGHEIGNHTYHHPARLTDLTDQEIAWELATTTALIADACAAEPDFWRAPHFDHDQRTDELAATLGMQHVGCTIDPGDWGEPSPARIATRVLDRLEDGAIVDLHDGIPPGGGNGTSSRQATVEAVRIILDALPDVEFVTVSDL